MTNLAVGKEPILLAFSGGLDTSFCVPWLAETYGRPVITVTVDTGGIDAAAAAALGERARRLGAIDHRLIDARDAGVEQVEIPARRIEMRAVLPAIQVLRPE